MLVDLSPWQKVKTSLRCAKNSKRRKRSDSNVGIPASEDFPAAASFVTISTKNVQQKWKKYSSEMNDLAPILMLTSSHNVSLLGRSKDDDSLNEFTSVRYTGRPGTAGSFFTSSSTANSKDSKNLPQIPVILDTKNDMVYGVQQSNTRLCCWHAFNSTGPNDKSSIYAELECSALSMSFLPTNKGIVYGTCEDGRLFVARVISEPNSDESTPSLLVEYFQSRQSTGSRHIRTFADSSRAQPGKKRKAFSDAADRRSFVVFYQVMSNDIGVQFVRHEVTCERLASTGSLMMNGGHSEQTTTVDLIRQEERENRLLKRVEVLVPTLNRTTTKIAVVYTVCEVTKSADKSKATGETLISLFCLLKGKISHKSLSIPSTSTQFGLVADTIIAAASSERICLLDLEHGGLICTLDLIRTLPASAEKWILRTDPKQSMLAILYLDGDIISTAISSLHSNNDAAVRNASLASMIASAATNSVALFHGNCSTLVHSFDNSGVPDIGPAPAQGIIRKAISALEDTSLRILSNQSNQNDDALLEVYEKSVSSVLGGGTRCALGTQPPCNPQGDNPQEASPSNEYSRMNARKSHRSKSLTPEASSTATPSADSNKQAHPPVLPQEFIDGSIRVIVSYLCSEMIGNQNLNTRKNALLILSQLVETGKVSARRHFEESVTTKEGDTSPVQVILRNADICMKKGCPCMDWILKILKHCSDVSERQLVSMLSYMVRYSSPIDIAESFGRSKTHSSKSLSKSRKRQKLNDKLEKLKKDNNNSKSALKIVMAGSTYVLQNILSYSECNEAMLKIALIEETGGDQEVIVLAKLLSNILSNRLLGGTNLDSTAVRSVCQWVSALCDAFHKKLAAVELPNGGNYLDLLIQSIEMATKQSEAIVNICHDISKFEQLQRQKEENAEEEDMENPVKELPGYSIKRLVF